MLRRGRSPDLEGFRDEEEFFRAFEPEAWEGDRISIDAIGLPDLSVNWGKHGPAEWLLLLEIFAGCGVGAFQVGDVPKRLEHIGIWVYTPSTWFTIPPRTITHTRSFEPWTRAAAISRTSKG
jgi:hypothetical protein